MQKQNQGALFVFSRVGTSYDRNSPYQTQIIYSQIMLGGLFVKGYRMLFKDKINLCYTFLKRVQHQTQYLFIKFIDSTQSQQIKTYLQQVNRTTNSVRKLKMLNQGEAFSYKVLLCYLNDRMSLQLTSKQFQDCCDAPEKLSELGERETGVRQDKKQGMSQGDECMDVVGGYELQKIKTIVWAYLDTFGAKHKDNIYNQFAKQGGRLNIDRIISTVNWIVYCETVDKPYNQLQSSNWTCFQAQAKEKCKSDRKQIVLTGSGRILFIPLLFICEKLDSYKRQCERELGEVIHESKKYYVEGQVKAYLITDQVDHHGLIYRTQNDSLRKFPA